MFFSFYGFSRFLRVAALLSIVFTIFDATNAFADLKKVLKKGVLRHIGVRYARFVTGSGDGFSMDLVKGWSLHRLIRRYYPGIEAYFAGFLKNNDSFQVCQG